MKISVLTNNESNPGFESEHGLSIYINHPIYNILFDVGYTNVYLKNSDKLGLNLNDIEYIVLSHGHYDHTGGLRFMNSQNCINKIYVHEDAFNKKYVVEGSVRYNGIPFKKEDLVELNDLFVETSGFKEVAPCFYLLSDILHKSNNNKYYVDGLLDDFHDETILILEDDECLSLFMGCSHFGVVNGVKAVKKRFPDKNIKNLLAGMHLGSKSIDELIKIGDELQTLDIETIFPLHCTGKLAIEYFKKRFKDSCVILKAGDQINI
ncbi:MAG: MBL fold metallo-hydrolase [Tenericutes bacterium]|nr:MBL fold metallo-hydrolase [Mycoplasmatota bacterium]